MLTVVDYGLSNLRSICGALDHLQVKYKCTPDPAVVSDASGLILPGVGAFPDAMHNLRNMKLIDVLNELVLSKKVPILGICLGFQLMATTGYEFKKSSGFGWINARVDRMQSFPCARIPHVGWNDCNFIKCSPLFDGIHDQSLFYFTHSYAMTCENSDDVLTSTGHGAEFVSSVQKSNIFGVQFHPEKSQREGIRLLNNFNNIVEAQCCEKE